MSENILNENDVVSVLMAINKDDGYFLEAVQSIQNQSCSNFEFVIVANNCSDELWQLILKRASDDSRISAYRVSLGGLAFALNYGLTVAKGKYIARMDADDIALENRLEEQLRVLNENPNIDVLGSQILHINKYGESLNTNPMQPIKHEKIVSGLRYKCTMWHPTVIYKRDVVIKAGGYKFGYYGEDFDLWIRLSKRGVIFHNMDVVHLKYRLHDGQMTGGDFDRNAASAVASLLFYHYRQTKEIGFLFGVLLQTRLMYKLINKTSRVRRLMRKK